MTNLFFYTREVTTSAITGSEPKIYTDSFNLNKVIRSVQMNDDEVLILLDDLHERSETVPDVDPKTGKNRGTKRERNTFQTEIRLSGADVTRFNNLNK